MPAFIAKRQLVKLPAARTDPADDPVPRRTHIVQANDYIFLTRWEVQGKADEAYEILIDVPGYLRWWPEVYLAVRPLAPAGKDGIGQNYRLLTRGKLPYRLRWDARIIETRRPGSFTIEATGDFVGRGVWTFEEHGSDLKILFDWRLRAEKPLLKSLSFLLRPLFRWNHRWAMARGEEGLRREFALRRAHPG
jgi:Polyketide cyclase / dehydrase and lipid transport